MFNDEEESIVFSKIRMQHAMLSMDYMQNEQNAHFYLNLKYDKGTNHMV